MTKDAATGSRWLLDGATPDEQSTDAEWNAVGAPLIDGVEVRDVRNVMKGNGLITEIFRRDWFSSDVVIDQVFQAVVDARSVSAWHAHEFTVDRLFVNQGRMRIVLYDGRQGSPTYGRVSELIGGLHRPSLVVVPPQVWHGVQNLLESPGALLNLPNRSYQYDAPDHWRLPADTNQIPYTFRTFVPTASALSRDHRGEEV